MENANPNHPQARFYTMNHPPLAPLASQEHDHPAPGIQVGDVIQEEHLVAASMQHTVRLELQKSNRATSHEVLAAKDREAKILFERLMPVPVGQDLAQELLQQMREVNTRMDEMTRNATNSSREMHARMDQMTRTATNNSVAIRREIRDNNTTLLRQMSIQAAQIANRGLLVDDTINPVMNNQGHVPPANLFPQFQRTIESMTEQNVDILLAFYGIVPERRAADENRKKALLCDHLGLWRLGDTFR